MRAPDGAPVAPRPAVLAAVLMAALATSSCFLVKAAGTTISYRKAHRKGDHVSTDKGYVYGRFLVQRRSSSTGRLAVELIRLGPEDKRFRNELVSTSARRRSTWR